MPAQETCANCQRLIGALEEALVWQDNIVCRECHDRLSAPKKMNRKYAVLAGVILAVVLGAYWLYLNNNRFYIMTSSRGGAYEVDRRTGKTWMLRGTTKSLQTDESLDDKKPLQLPSTDLRHLTGNAGLSGTGSFSGSLYNGTDWIIKQVTFQITVKEKDGSVRWSREYTDKGYYLEPKTSDSIYFSVAVGKEFGASTWYITGAQGFKE